MCLSLYYLENRALFKVESPQEFEEINNVNVFASNRHCTSIHRQWTLHKHAPPLVANKSENIFYHLCSEMHQSVLSARLDLSTQFVILSTKGTCVATVQLYFALRARRHNWDKRLGSLFWASWDRCQSLTQDTYLTLPIIRRILGLWKKQKIITELHSRADVLHLFSGNVQQISYDLLACNTITVVSFFSIWGR